MPTATERYMNIGAELIDSGVSFRVWAPRRKRVQVKLTESGELIELTEEGNGFFSCHREGLGSGTRYSYRLDDDDYDYPDPASRFQPDGVHGPSEVIDPASYQWHDDHWQGAELKGQVIYEMHLGCFTEAGTWAAAEQRLQHLVDTGITMVEVMPVADFDGQFGWGYDGVKWFAPTRLYGRPDDFRHFVDTAHQLGLAVILDVVYNHFGPTGNYTGAFSPYFVSKRHPTEWGDAINYDGEGAQEVRNFVIQNAAYWIREFHLDGLRLDATHSIYDDSPRHLLADLSTAARAAAKSGSDASRDIVIIAENETQDIRHVDPIDQGGFGLDGVWNDDFHHTCRVAATGHAGFYYDDFAGTAQELISATQRGYLFQGQYSRELKRWRGTPTWHVPGWRFVNCLQNHDQVANSAHGARLPELTSPAIDRALTTMWLLGPGTPMFFMGQEFGSRTPFQYFADHETTLADLVREGRWANLRQFPRIAGGDGRSITLPDPSDRATFESSILDWSACNDRSTHLKLHKDLLRLRREDPTFAAQDKQMIQGAVIHAHCFVLRWHNPAANDGSLDRLLLMNLGRDFHWRPAAEPLVAPPIGTEWRIMFSSEEPYYGGAGTAHVETTKWIIPGNAATLLQPAARETNDQ